MHRFCQTKLTLSPFQNGRLKKSSTQKKNPNLEVPKVQVFITNLLDKLSTIVLFIGFASFSFIIFMIQLLMTTSKPNYWTSSTDQLRETLGNSLSHPDLLLQICWMKILQ